MSQETDNGVYMSIKLLALGNILRMDDAIAIHIAKKLEAELQKMGIEVIFGETDISYCLSMVSEDDYLIIMDASNLGKTAGKITVLSLGEKVLPYPVTDQHGLNLIRLLQLCSIGRSGIILAIEAEETGFGLELSSILQQQLQVIAERVLDVIKSDVYPMSEI